MAKEVIAYPNNLVEGMPVELNRPAMKLGAIALVNTCVWANFAYQVAKDNFDGPKSAYAYVVDKDCGEVSDEVLRTVNENLTEPEDAELTSIFDDYFYADTDKDYREFAMSVAEEHGFTLIDYSIYSEQMDDTENPYEMISIFNKYTKLHGFSFSLDKDVDPLSSEVLTNFGTQHEKIRLYRQGLQAMLKSLFTIPKELTNLSNVTEIKIVNEIRESEKEGYETLGITNIKTGEIKITIDSIYYDGEHVLLHEIGHNIDEEICGSWGFVRDPEYKELNKPNFEYGDGISSLEKDENFVTEYSKEGVAEDKADMYSKLENGLDIGLLNGGTKARREKYRLLIARLEKALPGYSAYLARISPNRDETDPLEIDYMYMPYEQ